MRDKDHLIIKAYKRVEKEITITHILRQLRVFKKLTSKQLGLETWRHALKNYGIKDYTMNFSSSEDEKEKNARKTRNQERLSAAMKRSLGLQRDDMDLDRAPSSH